MHNNNSDRTDRVMLPRRDFLLMGSAVVAGVAASGLSADVIRAVAGPVGGSVLSIGFTDATAGEESRVARAERLIASDRELAARGARVTIHGYFRPEHRAAEPFAVDVTTFFPVGGQSLPVIAWSACQTRAVSTHASQRASLNVPADADGGITLGIHRRRSGNGAAAVPSRRNLFGFTRNQGLESLEQLDRSGSICRLTAGDKGVHLRPGTYFIAVGDPAREAAPDWSLAVMDANGALTQPSLTGRTAVPFEYLTVSVAPLTA